MSKLEKNTIISEALLLLNELGLEKLSTRKLAARLKVQQPALYWHFKSKNELIYAIYQEILKKYHYHSMPKKEERWEDFLYNNAMSFYKALKSYRDGVKIHLIAQMQNQNLEANEEQIKFLVSSGFSLENAIFSLIIIGHYITGSLVEEYNKKSNIKIELLQYPFLSKAIHSLKNKDDKEIYIYGLKLLIEGIKNLNKVAV